MLRKSSEPLSDGTRRARRISIASAHCRPFIRELRARGLETKRQLALLGIQDPEQGDLGQLISADQFVAFVRVAEELSQDPAIGLHAGAQMRLEDMGLLGLLMRSCANGHSAYLLYERYRKESPRTVETEISVGGAAIVCRRVMPGLPSSRSLSEYFVARVVTLMRQLFGPVEPIEVRLMHARPAELREHVRVLGQRLRFGEPADAVVFSAELGSRAMPHRDPVVAQILAHHLDGSPAAAAGPVELTRRVRRAISDELGQGRVMMRRVAGRLKLSERALRRQLNDAGMNFQRLVEEVRRAQALLYLQEASCSGTELSGRLGFRHPAAFYRAFRHWTGSSLSAYRDEQRRIRVRTRVGEQADASDGREARASRPRVAQE